ncbi:hypothetical protein KA005_35510, partial [bacterium]|nr:hypothetical protein [bacterium]
HIYEFTERIYKLTLRVSASGYHESLVSIEGLEDASYPFESQHTVYLRSKQSELHEVKVRSLHLYEDRTIFREVEGERKRFEVPDQLGEIKRALGRANWNPNDVNVRQAIEKLQPVTGYVITAAGYRPLDPRVGYIFSDHSGYRLLRMICPGGKSFTTGLDKLTDEDRWLRAQTFRVVGSILDESEELSLPPHLRLAIKEYGPLFRGHFEPLLVLELENRGSALHVIDQVIAEISDVEMYLGPDEKAGVSLQTHDIFVEPKVGAVQSRLAMPITLYPSGDLEGRDIIRFLVRLNPLTPYLHYWRMRFVLITSENRFVATDYFEIDM